MSTVEQQLVDRDAILDELKAQAAMKAAADKHRRDVQYNVNDLVYVKLRPYRLHSLAKKPNEKLGPRYFGPFKIIKHIGTVAYQPTASYSIYSSCLPCAST